MPILAILLANAATFAPPLPSCQLAQLRLSVDGRDGAFTGMSHAGTRLSLRNVGRDCSLPALPKVQFIDARGRVLPVARRPPPVMRPGRVVVRLAGGHRADMQLRWVSGPVFSQDRGVAASGVAVQIGASTLRRPLKAVLHHEAGRWASFEQTPLRVSEGMAADGS